MAPHYNGASRHIYKNRRATIHGQKQKKNNYYSITKNDNRII